MWPGVRRARSVKRLLVLGGFVELRETDERPGIRSRAVATGFEDHVVVDGEGPAGERAGDDCPRALGREHPVDPEAGPAAVRRGRRAREHLVERVAQLG